MFVQVDLSAAPPVVTLEEAGDTARFHVLVSGGKDAALVYGALVDAAAGRLEGDDAWIAVDAVRRMAVGRVSEGWDADLEAMLGYARSKGWLDEAGHAIRAHVEWPE
ncbi:MAG TPA: hypothetical protein VFW06_09495 [Acidimicrobiia bacterium]|nr:hypothetical protein [Acidimicrobiia bacterium]